MSSATLRLLGGWIVLLGGVQVAQCVTAQSKVSAEVNAAAAMSSRKPAAHHSAAHHSKHTFMKSLEDPHIHGEPGHQWRWVRTSDGKSWERHSVSDTSDSSSASSSSDSEADDTQAAETDAPAKTEGYYAGKKVSIDVYYETRCPFCVMFINQTLEPLWRNEEMKNVLNVSMYTYGNGMTIPMEDISEGYKFWHPETTGKDWKSVQICQHGADECFGNLVINCARDVAHHEKYMELIFCMAATTIAGYGEEKSTYECMKKADIDHHKVRECVTSPRGNDLVTEAGKETHLLKNFQGTPWVMVQGEHVEDQALQNTTVLMQAVCSHVNNVPVPCSPFTKPAAEAPAPSPSDDGDDFQVLSDMDFIKVKRDLV